ncbi:carbohydrate ABC transporter permease [Gryllotalpicola reticulitermitis]|uniref:Carbohydrate ABC transporter permease n=1 Tax=Gryllotalpicola reticulitermitis TaxID=1184153 RepID=A0ABV8Q489_9MICO
MTTNSVLQATRPRTQANRSGSARAFSRVLHNPMILIAYLVLALNTVSCLIPILWTLSNSFRSNTQIFGRFSLVPEQFDFGAYVSMITHTNILSGFLNSVIITGLSLALLFVCVLPAAFVLSRIRFAFSKVIYGFFLIAIFVPGIVLLQATYSIFAQTGLLDIPYTIVLAYTAGQIPFCLFLMVAYMREIDSTIEEAALVDGASGWRIFLQIILPMSRNGIVTIMILSFVSIWNDYIYALVFLPEPGRQTLTVALANAKGEYTVNYGLLSAAAILAIVPVFVFYLFTKNLLMNGMSSGAVKG